jgi:hypothetical protein
MDQTDLEIRETVCLPENDSLKAYPAAEVKLSMPNDNSITVFEGLPELTEQNTAIIPNKPHIFRANNVTIYQEKNGQPERLQLEDKIHTVCEQACASISKNPDNGRISLYLTTPSRNFLFIPEGI